MRHPVDQDRTVVYVVELRKNRRIPRWYETGGGTQVGEDWIPGAGTIIRARDCPLGTQAVVRTTMRFSYPEKKKS